MYASAWLKVHHPAAFAVALLNSQPMGFYSSSSLVEDAKRHGVTVLPPCVHASAWDSTLVDARSFRIGLREIRGLPEELGQRIVLEAARAKYTDVADVEVRAGVRKDHLLALAEAGALDVVTIPVDPSGKGADGGQASTSARSGRAPDDRRTARRSAVWSALAPKESPLFAGARREAKKRPANQEETLAEALGIKEDFGGGSAFLPPLTREEQLLLDYERTGLSVADHPMRIVRPRLPRGVLSSLELAKTRHGTRVSSAGVVLCRQRPMTASGVVFVTLEDEQGFVNLVIFAKTFERLRHVAVTSSMLLVTGKIERQADDAEAPVVYIVVEKLEKLSMRGKTVPSMSRDFR